jgi:hypothetical protein
MSERWDGFGDRIKRLNPIWMLGRGMNAGPLAEYVQMIGLSLLLEVFYRELDNNPQRTRDDLIEIVHSIIREMQLEEEADAPLVERIVNGFLWYKDSEMQQPFTGNWFDEHRGLVDSHLFRYFKEDRHHSKWEKGGKTVYQLSEESLEIIFMSRELLQELEISIDQLYVQQQMKRGNFRKALRGLDDLLARVRKLIRQEEEYREDIRRNPKFIFQQGAKLRSKREDEIRGQFEEEKRRFDELMYTLQRLTGPSEGEVGRLQEKIESTRSTHDRLAQLVLGNMSLELELRAKFPHLFWMQSAVTFRRSYWEEWILKDGVPEPAHLEALLAPLFSPQPDFLYPLEWAWEEQETVTDAALGMDEPEKLPNEEEHRLSARVVNWEEIADLWLPVIRGLLDHGEYALSSLRFISTDLQRRWLGQKEAVDLWLMFYGTEIHVPELEGMAVYSDDRLVLLQQLVRRDERIRAMEKKTMMASIEPGQPMIRWEGAVITPFVLRFKEVERR